MDRNPPAPAIFFFPPNHVSRRPRLGKSRPLRSIAIRRTHDRIPIRLDPVLNLELSKATMLSISHRPRLRRNRLTQRSSLISSHPRLNHRELTPTAFSARTRLLPPQNARSIPRTKQTSEEAVSTYNGSKLDVCHSTKHVNCVTRGTQTAKSRFLATAQRWSQVSDYCMTMLTLAVGKQLMSMWDDFPIV